MKHFYSRKSLFSASLFTLFFAAIFSCQKQTLLQEENNSNTTTTAQTTQRACATQEVLAAQLEADPSLQQRMSEIETFTRRVITLRGGTTTTSGTTTATPATITIPVVVNVVYNTPAQNVTDAQIQSQIDVLNEDFNRLNGDAANTPAEFSSAATTLGIQFTLNRIVRKSSTVAAWTTDNKIKSTKTGGLAPVNATTMLNIWVCNLSGGLLGYAQYPGGSSATDGLVIQYNAFGRTGTLMSRFNKGRSTTHEVGHWMNLRHIWGDAACGDDLVGDTPQHNAANSGLPAYPHYSTCAGTPVEMTMNYMDYTDDAGLNMFSVGQKDRARATFASGGPRYAYYIK